MLHYVVGIDPQRNLFAFYVGKRVPVTLADGTTKCTLLDIEWYEHYLLRKDSYKVAENWEIYLIKECVECLKKVESFINMDASGKAYHVKLGVEQQRGRVNSILESSLATAAAALGWEITIPHPKKWKAAIHFKAEEPGNNSNKRKAEELEGSDLSEFHTKKKRKLPKVVHHLCDARLIGKYVHTSVGQTISRL
jgi:hypothetical protein